MGGFVAFTLLDPGPAPAPAHSPGPVLVKRADPRPKVAVELPPSASDADLADQLDQARFDGDWERSRAVAGALRARSAAGVATQDGNPARGDQPVVSGTTSLARLDREHQREVLFRDLAARDNPARREAEAEATPEERVQRLANLFLRPPTQPDDEVVRRDAAFYLAQLRHPEARELLVRALSDPDEGRAEVAAAALGWSDDPAAVAALSTRLQEDVDPKVRLLAASGLTLAAPDEHAARALAKAAQDERELPIRQRAILGLARCDLAAEPGARRVLLEVLNRDTEPLELRRSVIEALGVHHGVTRRLPVELQEGLKAALSRTQGPLFLDAIGLLGRVASDPAPLEDALLKSRDPSVRAALEAALAEVRDRITPR